MRFTHHNKGTCSMAVAFDINDGIVTNVEFMGGCNGNLKAIGKLVDGMTADDIAAKLSGNTGGMRKTSCAYQLAKAVLAAKAEEQK